MTKTELLNIAIKIFGLYYFVRFIQQLMEFLFMVFGNNILGDGQLDDWIIYAGIFLTVSVDLIFAYVATFKTELITNRISMNNEGTVEIRTSKTDLLEIALAIISILAIAYSIPDILAQVVDNIYFHNHQESEFWTRPTKNKVIQASVTLLIGIFLLLNARNFANKIVKRGEQDDKRDQ